jgi:mono/diheme cytochrome c family protein
MTHAAKHSQSPKASAPNAMSRLLLYVSCLVTIGCETSAGVGPSTDREMAELRREVRRAELKQSLGEDYDRPLPAGTTDELRRGFELYDLTCAGCHGRRGRGDGRVAKQLLVAPGDLSDPARAAFFSERARLEIIRKGIPSTPMFGWEGTLGEDDLFAVFVALRYLNRGGSRG